jgi:hypothetical protein
MVYLVITAPLKYNITLIIDMIQLGIKPVSYKRVPARLKVDPSDPVVF